MAIYIVALLLLFFAAFIGKSKYTIFISIFLLLLISMLRGDKIGDDTIEYLTYDNRYSPTGIKRFEILFLFVRDLIPVFGRYTVVWFFSLVLFGFSILACKRYSVDPALALFFFVLFKFFNLSLNISRQFAAAGLMLYAFSFLKEEGKRKYLYFLFVGIAGSIHTSAWLFFPFFFIRYIDLSKYNKKILYVFIIIALIVLRVFLVPYLSDMASLFDIAEGDSLENYSNYFAKTEMQMGGSLGNVILVNGIYLIHLYILYQMLKMKDKNSNLLSVLFILSITTSILLDPLWGNLSRIKYNVLILNIIIYSYYFRYCKDRFKLPVMMGIIAFFGYVYYWDLSIGCFETVPYKSLF